MRITFVFLILSITLANAQVTDNFSDGNFTSSPTWSGDAAEYIVNASQQLQLSNSVAGQSYLSTPSAASSLNNMEWSFYVKQTFSPSSSNYGRVYLASDNSNLENPLNGYYLQFGEALSNDAVELFRQAGSTSTSVCRGTNGQIASSFAIGVRVTRDASGMWSLYVDATGGTAYVLEASGTDNTFATTNFFGVSTLYTVSYSHNFFYDNFYNGAIIIDTAPPTLSSTTVISSSQLDILFNEAVDLTTSQTLTNYSANNSLGNPSVATRDGSNFDLVHLTFASSFVSGLLNTLTVINVQDLSSNAIATATSNFTYIAPVVPVYKDIIITEIMADETPQVNVPAVEFIELFNKSLNTFDLSGWKFTDGSSTATLGNYVLSPNQYVIICNSGDTALFAPYGFNHIGVSSFPFLNNPGDHIYLKDNTLVTIDSVIYTDDWYQDATKKLGGWTLELINPNANAGCPASSNWIASNNVDGGTPGTQNSVYSNAVDVVSPTIVGVTVVDSLHINICFSEALDASQISNLANYSINSGIGTPTADTINATLTCAYLTLAVPLVNLGTYMITLTAMSDCAGNALLPAVATFSFYTPKPFDVVINEIMADPDPQYSSLPNYEYVELYNTTSYAISLYNWTFSAGTTNRVLPEVTILPDSFIVFSSTSAASSYPASFNVVGVTSFPAFTNTGQTLTLKNAKGAVISTVSYTDGWYGDNIKKDGGWSLEQIDPLNPCAGMSNWRASVSNDAGTPGRKNSIDAINADASPPQAVRVSVISVDTIQLYFNESIDSTTMLNASIYSIDNGIGNPSAVVPISPDYMSVRLSLATALQLGVIYNITVLNSVTDCVGNLIGADNTVRFALPEAALPNDIVINEILFDPNLGGVDFVEIYNRSTKVVDLKSLVISEFDTVANIPINPETIAAEGFLMFPGDYILLSENGTAVKSQYNTTNAKGFVDVSNLITMNISGGTVCLTSGSAIIDNFIYYDNMQFALLNVTKGVSLERIDFNRATQDRTNWHSAAQDIGFATPAFQNSQYHNAGETDNAIEITPEIFSPDEDGTNDVVNINYHFDTPGYTANVAIYDSKGREVKHLLNNELLGIKGTFSWDGINDDREKSRIGIYIIYFEVFDLSGTVKHYKRTCVLGAKL